MRFDLPEAWCWQILRDLRWPARVRCPHCGIKACRHYHRGYIRYYRCRQCNRVFSDLSATPFEGTHVPLAIWFEAIGMLLIKERLFVKELTRVFRINRETARRIRQQLLGRSTEPLIRSIGASVVCFGLTANKPQTLGIVLNGVSDDRKPHS